MRAWFGCFSLVALGVGIAACPAPKMPTGPSPEYEDPPAPSWLEGGAPGAHEGGAPPATTLPGSDQTPPPPAS